MDVTLAGIATLVRPKHELKASSPMLARRRGNVMPVRLVQLPNANSAMRVTLAGKTTLVRWAHPKKALGPMLVTGYPFVALRMTITPLGPVQPVMVIVLSVLVTNVNCACTPAGNASS